MTKFVIITGNIRDTEKELNRWLEKGFNVKVVGQTKLGDIDGETWLATTIGVSKTVLRERSENND